MPSDEENNPVDDLMAAGEGTDEETDDEENATDDLLDDVVKFNLALGDGSDENTGAGEEGNGDNDVEIVSAETANLRAKFRTKPKNNEDNQEEHAIVECITTAGPFTMHLHRSWSPKGYDRATSLFERGYYDRSHFFRVVPHFLVQFGIGYPSDPSLKQFAGSRIEDDPHRQDLMPFKEGYVSFAGSGKDSRTSHLFIAYDHAQSLGTAAWETPFGEVVKGMKETVEKFYSGYGDMPPWGKGPEQGPIYNGPQYIEEGFPLLDRFETCTVKRVKDIHSLTDGATKKKKETAKVPETASRKIQEKEKLANTQQSPPNQQMPFLTLVVALSAVVLVIVGYGFISRKQKRTAGKSV